MKIALLGYGKMGKTIERLALEKGHDIVLKTSSADQKIDLSEADIAIEFSTPDTAFKNIVECLNQGTPVVSGTTGWLKEFDEVLNICESRNGSFIYASNFSIGVNLFFYLNEYMANLMKDRSNYEAAVEEVHHTQKKDAPSGTAISLVEGMLKNSKKTGWILNEASSNDVTITSKRIDDVKGTHIITYTSQNDILSIKHEAKSRDGFAQGAILAAEWLIDKKGVFNMKDVLEI